MSDLKPGDVLRGKYEILGEIGRGGMGVVYRARHILLNEVQALKLLLDSRPQFVKGFLGEAQLVRRLRHPAIVEVFDVDVAENGFPFVVMEYLEGPSLRQLLDRGRLSPPAALEIAAQVCDGLAFAHHRGVIHRDVKPQNIILTTGSAPERVKVIDFGIAKVVAEADMQVTGMLTAPTGFALGTPEYSSPEQAMGLPSSQLDARSDLYSVGLVLYEMLSGAQPFTAPTPMGLLIARLQQAPRPITDAQPDLNPTIVRLVMRSISSERESRFQTGEEMANALRTLRATLVGEPVPEGAPPRPGPVQPSPTVPGPATGTSAPPATPAASDQLKTPAPSPPPARPVPEFLDTTIYTPPPTPTTTPPRPAGETVTPPPTPTRPRTAPKFPDTSVYIPPPTASPSKPPVQAPSAASEPQMAWLPPPAPPAPVRSVPAPPAERPTQGGWWQPPAPPPPPPPPGPRSKLPVLLLMLILIVVVAAAGWFFLPGILGPAWQDVRSLIVRKSTPPPAQPQPTAAAPPRVEANPPATPNQQSEGAQQESQPPVATETSSAKNAPSPPPPKLAPAPPAQPAPTPAKKMQPSTQASGSARLNSTDGLNYVPIPSGEFMMGCSDGDGECQGDEKPAHGVRISRPFWMGQTSVTVAAWKKFRAARGKPALPVKDNFGRLLNEAGSDDSMPAVALTWDEAREFCEWSGGRLPTEAEWEYAARAGSNSARHGSLDEIAWFGDNSGNSPVDTTALWASDRQHYAQRLYANGNGPHAVGRKKANAWRLYDTLGNVWNWVADWYSDSYYQQGASVDPPGPPSGTLRGLRGGSWFFNPRSLRVSDRFKYTPNLRVFEFGCRCARDQAP